MVTKTEEFIAKTFMAMADGLAMGTIGPRSKIALTGMGSELGENNVLAGALLAAQKGVDVSYIGTQEHDGLRTVFAADAQEGHRKMEAMLEAHEVDGAVTMHFPFPIGISTIARVVTPARGRQMFIAAATGTAGTDRVESMIRNALYGVITAKTCGIFRPSVGILNIDGARQAERALRELAANGYDLRFAESSRADGGSVMRGNDVLQGTPDVLVTDSLTGNVLTKMLASYTTGGIFEAMGFGYGPGIGEGYDKLILIVSRVSGAPVIAQAIAYAAELIRGQVFQVGAREFAAARKAGLAAVIEKYKTVVRGSDGETAAPPKEVVTAQLVGIEIMDLEAAVKLLWKQGMYAESGMGCTGPVIRIAENNAAAARMILQQKGYLA